LTGGGFAGGVGVTGELGAIDPGLDNSNDVLDSGEKQVDRLELPGESFR
jgi:hypothetical protein